MALFGDVAEVEAALEALAGRPGGALVARLPREPGRRESRYAQLFTGAPPAVPEPGAAPAAAAAGVAPRSDARDQDDVLARLAALEAEVRALQSELAALRGTAPLEG